MEGCSSERFTIPPNLRDHTFIGTDRLLIQGGTAETIKIYEFHLPGQVRELVN